jgi:glycyl-tRNA synthetase beta chain
VSRLLFEIGVEELPAGYVPPALDQFERGARAALAELRLTHGEVRAIGTPRRLVLTVADLEARQSDHDEEAVGPAAKAAFDAEGQPTKALLGFCRGKGADPASVRKIDTPKGEYVAVTVHHAGKDAAEVLPEALANVATRLQFPKSMRWLDDDTRFARPVRWLVALLDDQVIPVRAFGLEAGRRSFGHRFLSPAAVKIGSAAEYVDVMDGASVIADPAMRAARLRDQIGALAAAENGRVVDDPELIEINNFLVEWPTAFTGRFDAKYLDLPREVIVTALREHQRFFAVEDAAGHLMPLFIAVRNGDDRGLDGVRRGNEGVLIARLEDARFYWETDLKHAPAERVEALSGVVWMEGLGSLREKATRLESLTAWIAGMIAPSAADAARRAALLCKTDLLSEMIGSGKEYTSLEGIVGGYYARRAGESEAVGAAIAEHYRPRGPADALPVSAPGLVLALADKLDHVAGAFVAGKVPSGSEDPYGVRRAANGVLRMLLEGGRHLDLRAASMESTQPFFAADPQLPHAEIMKKLGEFWRGRVDSALDEHGIPYDSRDAALEARIDAGGRGQPGWTDPADALERARVLSAFRSDARFEPLVVLFKRVSNILKAASEPIPPALDRAKFTEAAERDLHAALERARERTAPLWERRAYAELLPALLEMEAAIHRFFDEVLVNAEDPAVRGNRLRLLTEVREMFLRGWDLARVVVEGERATTGVAAG